MFHMERRSRNTLIIIIIIILPWHSKHDADKGQAQKLWNDVAFDPIRLLF